ncbi:uncharacterized protein J8A68_002342 [[Candida] subhashii]|uniref:BioF2-like acetyltransferase domain-containing protein n=1 Tax=[Candida] subhashii TaxID=561895 RepID=A0A8J5V163_9ASCO|nr:uncharacterized protein J8A68_002342 [[Candida] subhashii]KAG7664159.1 hypothetical protein J8A68_002342 [[Candida] subhashii]
MTSGKLENPLKLNSSVVTELDIPESKRVTYLSINVVSAVINGLLLCIWWSTSISKVYLVFASSNLFQILISIALIEINISWYNVSWQGNRLHNLFVLSASFILGQSMMGLLIAFLINPKNRLNDVIGKMVFLFDIVVVLFTLLVLGCMVTAAVYTDFNGGDLDDLGDLIDFGEMPVSVAILFACTTALNVIIFVCTRYFRLRTFTEKIHVEEYNLNELTPYQKQGWAKLIDMNKKYNAGTSGDQVVSLMENYTNSKLHGMKCKVLRVFRDHNVIDHNQSTEKPKQRPELSNRTLSTAFKTLDREVTLFHANTLSDSDENIKDLEEKYKPLSKNQLKKLAKKSKQQKQLDDLKSLENNTEKFYQELVTTEALVMITIIEEFDLAERIPGGLGRVLSKWFGKDSRFPLLCIKFGLLGFHWPFKRSTFYCSQTKKPVARATAVLSAISNWNRLNEKCTVLLDPMYADRDFEVGIDYSGWVKIKLPNSHVIDLRPFANSTPNDYFKAIKYRNQDGTFKQAKGEVLETDVFNFENCQEIIDMNQKIASNRSSSGQSSQLLQPDWEFIYNLGNYSNENKYRTLMYLKVDGKIIASCVLFRLGETMTSDIQGLDHEISKKYKAYFVMMQEVIKIGMKERVSFIDFGPTTEEPKCSIGCHVVPLTGCLYPKNKSLAPIIKFAASKVDV